MSIRPERVKETNRMIREARSRWDAHENSSCRKVRDEAIRLYEGLTADERALIPEQLKVWLRYRSEKYFGEGRTLSGKKARKLPKKPKKKSHSPEHAIFSRRLNSPVGSLVVLSSKKGIAGLYFGHRIENSTLPPENPRDKVLNLAEIELGEYFSGAEKSFRVALDARGSAFQKAVWRELSRIPFGETRGYGEIAEHLDNPGAVRAVGAANGANPISIIVPCHRVIGKDGSLTGFGGGVEIKKKLLQHEGVLLGIQDEG
ncbi:methylated-DNA--[protein]-cysteine S-methyltransferase [Verrucomicrobiaceae bacterium 227]